MSNAIREIIICLLVILIIMLALAIAFYTYLPNKKSIPSIEEYIASEEIQDSLNDDIDTRLSQESKPVYTYEVTSSDLANYQKEDDYIPMKLNPFRDISDLNEVTKSVTEHVILEEETK